MSEPDAGVGNLPQLPLAPRQEESPTPTTLSVPAGIPDQVTIAGGCGCGGRCGGQAAHRITGRSTSVYGVGRVRGSFAHLGAERELQAVTGADPHAVVPAADLAQLLADPSHRHVATQMCWTFESRLGTPGFTLVPRDREDLTLLIDFLQDDDLLHVIVGSPAIGGSPFACPVQTGLPAVWLDQLFSFNPIELIEAMPTPSAARSTDVDEGAADETAKWQRAGTTLFDWLTRRLDNTGVSEQHRALNYLAVRYPAMYHLAYDQQRVGKVLIGLDAYPRQGQERRAVLVRLTFRNPHTQVVERYHCEVDIHDVLPFVTRPFALSYD